MTDRTLPTNPDETIRQRMEESRASEDVATKALRDVLIKEGQPDICNTTELQALYEVSSFAAPFVFVKRKSDNVRGTMKFHHHPRLYYKFEPLSQQ